MYCILTTTCCGRKYISGEVVMGSSGMLEAIRWQMGPPASLRLLDQRLLPAQSVYVEIDGPQAAYKAIKVVLTCLHTSESALVRLICIAPHQITRIVLRRSLTHGSAVGYNLLGSSDFKKCDPQRSDELSESCEIAPHLQDMAVRGAPAIAISAALALAVELVNNGGGSQFSSAKEAQDAIDAKLDYLVTR